MVTASNLATNKYGYYTDFSGAKNVYDFNQKIDAEVKKLGLSNYWFVRLESLESDNRQALCTVPPELMRLYFKQQHHENDPILKCKKSHYRSTIYEEALDISFSCEHTQSAHEVKKLLNQFGYYDSYTITSAATNNNGYVQFSVFDRGAPPFEFQQTIRKCRMDLELLCEAIDFVSTRKFHDELLAGEKQKEDVVTINSRPLEVLDMLANNDINITQVARELDINVVTANRHLQAVRKAFDVRTNHAAIRKAIKQKLIEYK